MLITDNTIITDVDSLPAIVTHVQESTTVVLTLNIAGTEQTNAGNSEQGPSGLDFYCLFIIAEHL